MKRDELIAMLQALPEDAEIRILDCDEPAGIYEYRQPMIDVERGYKQDNEIWHFGSNYMPPAAPYNPVTVYNLRPE